MYSSGRSEAEPKPSMPAERLVPYLQLLVVPLMARMSDPLPAVRTTAAPAFAAIVALVPLAQVRTTQAAWPPLLALPASIS